MVKRFFLMSVSRDIDKGIVLVDIMLNLGSFFSADWRFTIGGQYTQEDIMDAMKQAAESKILNQPKDPVNFVQGFGRKRENT